jgi:hypothetical protein
MTEPISVTRLATQNPPSEAEFRRTINASSGSGGQVEYEVEDKAEEPEDDDEAEEDVEEEVEAEEEDLPAQKKGKKPEKGKWWPYNLTEADLSDLEKEGILYPKAESCWRVVPGELHPNPQDGERVITKALMERGFSFPPSDFLMEVLSHYGLQPHNLLPNSITVLSSYVALCEGYLGILQILDLFKFFFGIKRESVRTRGPLANCGSVSFKICDDKKYPVLPHHESVRFWSGGFFYCKDKAAPGKT